MSNSERKSKLFIGLIIFLGGILALLDKTGAFIIPYYDLIFHWKMLFVLFGVYKLIKQEYSSGFLFVFLGLFFYTFFSPIWGQIRYLFWPLIAIMVGLYVMFRSLKSKKSGKAISDSQSLVNLVDELAIFGGTNRVVHSNSFEGGELVSVFGGVKLDLNEATTHEDGAKLEVSAVFGGNEIIVQKDCFVELSVNSVFGGVKDERKYFGDPNSRNKLIITGIVVFGAVTVKN